MRGMGIVACLVWLWAQPPGPYQRVRSLQIAYLAEAMQLLPEEAQAFWPVYNAREAALQKARQAVRERFRNLREKRGSLSAQAFADSVSALYLSLWEKEAQIRREYDSQFRKVLPPEKLARFYLAEVRLLRRALGEERNGFGQE
ncbi:MAG: hypothetical protein KatS3mg026_0453 [Bacteroidia bacterium]|nr:MAG: hypothetical protein KatS3mg026_0453 [Bacteroidia bacterium]